MHEIPGLVFARTILVASLCMRIRSGTGESNGPLFLVRTLLKRLNHGALVNEADVDGAHRRKAKFAALFFSLAGLASYVARVSAARLTVLWSVQD